MDHQRGILVTRTTLRGLDLLDSDLPGAAGPGAQGHVACSLHHPIARPSLRSDPPSAHPSSVERMPGLTKGRPSWRSKHFVTRWMSAARAAGHTLDLQPLFRV